MEVFHRNRYLPRFHQVALINHSQQAKIWRIYQQSIADQKEHLYPNQLARPQQTKILYQI